MPLGGNTDPHGRELGSRAFRRITMKPPRLALRILSSTAIMLAVSTFGFAPPASACSCMGPLEWLRTEGGPNIVFVGEMIELREIEARNDFGEEAVEMTFQVDTVYRGEIKDHVFVQSHRDDGGNCGFSGGNGSMVILASEAADGALRTDGCSVMSVSPDGSTERDLEQIVGVGRQPDAVDPVVLETVREQRRVEVSDVPWAFLMGGVVVLGLLGVGLTMAVREQDVQ